MSSEWSDEAVEAALSSWYGGRTARPELVVPQMRAALTAADAVRKREAGEKDPAAPILRWIKEIQEWHEQATHGLNDLDRRLATLEAARPEPTIKPDLKVAEPERRCGTCRFRPAISCMWPLHETPPGVTVTRRGMASWAGTDCPTWEARP